MTNYNKKIVSLYKESPWISFFTKIRFSTGSFEELEKLIPKTGKILDLGCGYGIFANYLAISSSKREIVGVDLDGNKIKHADKGIPNVKFFHEDATKMNLSGFSVIILHDLLHHLNSYGQQEDLIVECKEMLVKKGLLVVIEVDNYPKWKFILGRITDFIMYKGQPVYYRYEEAMIKLLKKYFKHSKIKTTRLVHNPFAQITYVCQK